MQKRNLTLNPWAALVLLPLLGACQESDDNTAELTRLRAELKALREEVATLQSENSGLAERHRTASEAYSEAQNAVEKERTETGSFATKTEQIEKEIRELETEFEAYRRSYEKWVRSGAVGMKFDRLDLGTGKVFENATISSLNHEKVGIRTPDAIAGLSLADLPPRLREKFGFDPTYATIGDDLSVVQAAKKAMLEAKAERLEREKEFKELLRKRSALGVKERGFITEGAPVPPDLTDQIERLTGQLKAVNTRMRELIDISNENMRIITHGGVPPEPGEDSE